MKRISLWLVAALAGVALASCSKAGSNEESDKKISALQVRVAQLEKKQKDFEEIQTFLKPIMEQQKAEEEKRAASMPDPDARFNVNIAGSPTHGPDDAVVTIIEAFDFA